MNAQEVWTAYADRLRRFVGARLRDANDVDDVLQDVFTKVHAGLAGVEDATKLEAWLFQVARRAVVDRFRSRRMSTLREEPAVGTPEENVGSVVASWLAPMMEQLPPEDREALRLTDVEGLPQKDLAARLGLSVTGAKSRVQRARRRLKDALLACCRVETDRRGNPVAWTPVRCPCA